MILSPYHAPARPPAPDLSGLAPLASPTFNGQVRLPAGSAAAPALSPAGDGDSGLFAPAADTLALATGGQQRLTVDPGGRALLNHPASLSGAFNAVGRLQILQDGNPSTTFWRFNANDVGGAYVFFERSRGSSAGQNVAVQAGDGLGQISFNGANGTTYHRAAILAGEMDGAPGTGSMPGRLMFYTTPAGTTGPVERLRIGSDGTVTLGQYMGAESLRVVPIGGAVSRIEVYGAAAGAAPAVSAAGVDANIDLTLAPKGTGRLRFGSYAAAGGLTPTGYIEIKDAGGTARRLLVA